MALCVACAYCTVSNNAIMVVTGTVPIHLLAFERAAIEAALKTNASSKNEKQEARSHDIGNDNGSEQTMDVRRTG